MSLLLQLEHSDWLWRPSQSDQYALSYLFFQKRINDQESEGHISEITWLCFSAHTRSYVFSAQYGRLQHKICWEKTNMQWRCSDGINSSSHNTNKNGAVLISVVRNNVVLISVMRGRCMHWQCIPVFSNMLNNKRSKKVFFDKWQTETCRSKTLSKYYNRCRDTKIYSAILIHYSTKTTVIIDSN